MPSPSRIPQGRPPDWRRLQRRFVLLMLSAAAYLLQDTPAPPREQPVEFAAEPAPLQEWTVDGGAQLALVSALLRGLPAADPRQRRAPCDEELEKEINGLCWIPLALDPCPKGKAFLHEGKCYARALNAARIPSSGEPRPVTVADPP